MEHSNHCRLDNPTWNALVTKQSALAQGNELAHRYDADVAPFAGVANTTQAAFHALASIIPQGGFVFLPSLEALPPVDGIHHDHVFSVIQMVDAGNVGALNEEGVQQLGMSDVPEMLALTERTRPGPFGKRTIEMGNYIGMRADGELIAMAGERMRLDGYVEISAVCVDERHRGKGLAARLMNILRQQIKARGDTPFLHVKDDNETAIALYKRMGFETRQTLVMNRVALA
ncbi:GNAT family N-acetyltransferase [Pandoraea sputorum]|uniref:GNAT family N-acetyltransferase n=1 Tax=Pandoraea sputorum TaxID=93222 RepID=UPI001E404A74|nr:GNAT family N-acetyltransferase [Pandoraea sputorum]MCE4061966.1 GNAT family N-acetyltransferase [Pandoraea sputorum]